MTDTERKDAIPVAAELGVHGEARSEEVRAEQGPPPADFAERPPSGVPVPTGDALDAAQVMEMTGEAGNTSAPNAASQETGELDPGAGE